MTWNEISFRKRMLIIMTFSGLVELLILALAGFSYIRHQQEEDMGQKALRVAKFLSESPAVIEMIRQEDTSQQQYYRDLTYMIGAAFIVIGNRQGIRLVHPLNQRIGLPMVGGDNQQALREGRSYISFAHGSLGRSVRGKSAVVDASGHIIGVVSVGYLIERLQDRVEPYLHYLLIIVVLVVIVNGLISGYISRRFQKAILGFEPEEIGRLYGELDVTMSTLKEGILSIDEKGYLRSINRSACKILGIDKSKALNRLLTDSLHDSNLYTLLETGRTDSDIELYLNHQWLIANRSPIVVDGRVVGAVASFRLRDEINDLTEQLSQTKAYAELLRSQTHEHRNKLNTISGLVQMGELEAVQQLIGQETEHYQALIEFLRGAIKDPLIAGMLLGKSERARELSLELRVEEGTKLDALPEHLHAEDVVTILGNLIDNAFEAVLTSVRQIKHIAYERRIIDVSISDYGNEIILEVDDQGCGLPDGVSVDILTERGVSSKSHQGRGVGLFLVQQLTDRYHGQLDMFDKKGNGTRMTVYLPKEPLI
ncbi:Sensor histidine kinase DpiB [Vibrio ruber DSM 16370]|uniref:histidine kinase n=1 Tax=Vibrio ruber (strain DSM 16370 / JCM 11486 / BCRC 17186 / CECT 7878 / LMG 23124 / VR1) TaxID=1123498 RepID=A0A1R4LJE4_VIBR1|nr:sensor histidine kinase [Vibrio ruber]SJN56457.1 Sensor histidine kinase DpiB [Vibrio ruber DSM 16370]